MVNIKTRSTFKAPKYCGDTDIDLFIDQFSDVARANQWSKAESKLNFRISLERPAHDCGRGDSTSDIMDNLRARYGLTARQARDKLASIKKTTKQSVYELGLEITRLVNIAYPNQDSTFCIDTSVLCGDKVTYTGVVIYTHFGEDHKLGVASSLNLYTASCRKYK